MSDLYSEYNRLRKNIMQQARYYKISMPKLPTAKQLGRTIQNQDISTLQAHKRLYITPLTYERQQARITARKIKPSTQIKRKPSPSTAYEKYSTRFLEVADRDGIGVYIDKRTKQVVGYISITTPEELGQYLNKTYASEYNRPLEKTLEEVFELQAFKDYIQARLKVATTDMLEGQHGSGEAIKKIQDALNKMSKSDFQRAYTQYENFQDEIKNRLDDALYYSESEQDHLQALNIIVDLLSLNKDALDFSYEDYDLDKYKDVADYKYGRPYKYTKQFKGGL